MLMCLFTESYMNTRYNDDVVCFDCYTRQNNVIWTSNLTLSRTQISKNNDVFLPVDGL